MDESGVKWLRLSYWTGATIDALAALQLLWPPLFGFANGVPGFSPGADYRFAAGTAASLMLGWTVLLLWADRRPVERRAVLVLTVFPVIAGLAITEVQAVKAGLLTVRTQVPIWILQLALASLFLASYRRSGNSASAS